MHATDRCISRPSRGLEIALRIVTKVITTPFSNPCNIRHHSSLTEATKRVIFSGIQPTGIPHLGNYLGALQQWVRLQNSAPPSTTLLFSIVDLHAITTRQDRKHLRRWKMETLAALLAVGLDPGRSTIFFQSDVCNVEHQFPICITETLTDRRYQHTLS